jgi:hypothetical protein
MKFTDGNSVIVTLVFMLTVSMTSFSVGANCNLPIPEGGEVGYIESKENIFGDIVKVKPPYVFIRDGRTQQVEKFSLSKLTEVYSSYDGYLPLSVLKPKLQTWVWFKNCTKPKTGVPEVAYFQFFSEDPKDRATLDSNGKILSTP